MIDPSLAVSAVEVCFKYGAIVVEYCQRWKHANQEVRERIAIIEASWNKTRVQVDFVQRISDHLDSEHRRILDDTLGILAEKLSLAVSKIQKVLAKNGDVRPGFLGLPARVRRTKYALEKKALDEVIKDLESWQQRFDPSWFLIMRLATPDVDRKLQEADETESLPSYPGSAETVLPPSLSTATLVSQRPRATTPISLAGGIRYALSPEAPKEVILPPEPLHKTAISFSTAKIVRRVGSTGTRWFVIDTLPCRAGTDPAVFERNVRNLAKKLSKADPFAFGLLRSRGAMRVYDGAHPPNSQPRLAAFDLVLNSPGGTETLQSMRHVLLTPEATSDLSLNRRIRIARELAQSVGYVHTFGFVHKNIRPESVLLFRDPDPESSREATLLVGFGDFRPADGSTLFANDTTWETEIYRHPTRQGETPEEKYTMHHDVYSLGVCLLELGLWETFVDYADEDARPRYGRLHDDFLRWVADSLPPGAGTNPAYASVLAWRLKDYMVELAQTRLPRRVGDRFAEVVVTCLTCLDEGNDDFGGEEEYKEDKDGIQVGVRFIETVLSRLDEIVM